MTSPPWAGCPICGRLVRATAQPDHQTRCWPSKALTWRTLTACDVPRDVPLDTREVPGLLHTDTGTDLNRTPPDPHPIAITTEEDPA